MTKQDILDSLESIRAEAGFLSTSSAFGHDIEKKVDANLSKVVEYVNTSLEYRPGDKAILRSVIEEMPRHPHVDDLVSIRALGRLAGGMND